ncbi:TolC family protein [Acidithiobacillus thiooxidans]|uniref:TolC family protein n=1 Tax=Acidithiobacillus thiooxidans TaxID=930 RepID=UPI001C07DD0C|nr:TolC family protein [Acidithiobacillus thiooxidans]MBU2836057.1 TolC family protein [Acidithiobacillus thiooxidans]
MSGLFLSIIVVLAVSAQQVFAAESMSGSRILSLTLAHALAIATLHEDSIVSADANVKQAQSGKLAAIGTFLPSLSLSDQAQLYGPVGRIGNTFIAGTQVSAEHSFYYNSMSANLSENLFAGGKDLAEFRAAKEAISSAKSSLISVVNTTFGQIIQSYIALANDQRTVIAQQHIVHMEHRIAQLTFLRYHHGLSSRIAWLQSKQQELQAETQLITDSQEQIKDAKTLLRSIGYRHPPALIMDVDSLPPPPAVTKPPIKVELNDPAIQSARAQIHVAQEQVAEAKAGFWPQLSLVAQYNWLGVNLNKASTAILDTKGSNYTFGLSLSIPLLPAVTTVAAVQSAQAQIQSRFGAYDNAWADVSSRRLADWASYEETERQMHLALRTEHAARKTLDLTIDRWKARQSNYLQVYQAKISNAQTMLAVAQTRNNLALAQWEVFRAEHPRSFSRRLLSAAQNVISLNQ